MKSEKFFHSSTAIITLFAACFVVLISLGVRQTFGLYSSEFEMSGGTSNTEFGLAIAIHAIFWGVFTPIFGRISDKFGGYVVIIPALIFYALAMFLMGSNYISGIWLQVNLGLFVGLGLAGAAGTILTPMISKHFPNENRSKAAGVVTACGGLGMFIFPILASIFKNISTWHLSFILFSIILLLMCIPGLFVKLPETNISSSNTNIEDWQQVDSKENIELSKVSDEANFLEAIGNGATEGLKLALNIAAMLIAFISVIALINWVLGLISLGDIPLSIELILGYLFMPLAFLMGAPWSEAQILGSLMGQKLVLTEFIAYGNLAAVSETVSERTATIAAYALCGFANFASIGIQLGGIGSIAPERKKDLAKLVTKAMLGGALASWLTATIAGILI